MRYKILIPSHDFKPMLGGIANYIHEAAAALQEQGDVDVRLIARSMPGDKEFDQSVPYQVQRISSPNTAILSIPAFTKAIREEIRNWKPDCIFTGQWFPDATATYLALKLTRAKIPYMLVAHGTEIFDSRQDFKNEIRHWMLLHLRARVLQGAEKIFTVSKFTRDSVIARYQLPKTRFVHTLAGVNTSIYKKISPGSQKTENFPLLLTVTRLHPYKGVDKVIASLPAVLKQFPGLQYWIAGSGPDRARLEALVAALNLQDTVRFLGPQKLEDLVALYNTADLFVLMTRQALPDVEGFGLVFLEAAACGLPALGGRSGGIPEAVEENKSGWLVDPEDTAAIAEKIKWILSSPEELKKAGDYCLAAATQKTWREVALRIRNGLIKTPH